MNKIKYYQKFDKKTQYAREYYLSTRESKKQYLKQYYIKNKKQIQTNNKLKRLSRLKEFTIEYKNIEIKFD